MKVLLRENIYNLGTIGEIVDVKPGFARNYLLPHGKALQPTQENVDAVESVKAEYLAQLARKREELQAKAQVVDGKVLTLEVRANEDGHLYGSVGAAQIVAQLAEVDAHIEASNVLLSDPIREIGEYDVVIRFAEDVQADVKVIVNPTPDSEYVLAQAEREREQAAAQAEAGQAEAAEKPEEAESAE